MPSTRKRTTNSRLERLDMDIAGAVFHRLRQQAVDQLDNRRGVVGLEQVGRFLRQLARDLIEPLFFEIDHQIVRRGGRRLIVSAVDRLGDNLGRRHHRLIVLPNSTCKSSSGS